MARILSAWLPNWPVESRRRRLRAAGAYAGPSDDVPFALTTVEKNARRLTAMNAAAAARGLVVGQALADARARLPELEVAEAEPDADLASLHALAEWAVRFSPAVAPDAPDGLLLDVTGVGHLWGDEDALLADLLGRLARDGITARGAVADTPGAAWALARWGDGAVIAPEGGAAATLRPLPVEALRLADDTAFSLRRLGLTTVEQLLDAPRAPLAKRFGKGLLLRLDQATGAAEEALVFRRPPKPWRDRLAFFEPVSAPEDLLRVTQDLCALACRRLERAGRGARRFELAFHRVDATFVPVRVGTATAARDPVRLARLFAPKLDAVDPGFGVESVTLDAARVEPVAGRQTGLDDPGRETAQEGLAALVDRLTNRLGDAAVWRPAPVQSWVPERAVARAAPLTPPPPQTWDPDRPRPIRLFKRPEPIEATALLPDDPPVQFEWRGRVRRVRRAEGPERIAQEWWRVAGEEIGADRFRDYYRVEDEDGARFWLFRTGVPGGAREVVWRLHGVFG
jgi:protein ImuB